ncbi:MAG: phosphatidyl-myo-inositol alpha-mannosyltransferase [Solirubrobacteraceae bacterium]|nr:phosphatidyl-myo-inositol alpha-mannosyltransferase [Solirubrobacteraceae bacterium]
MTDKLRIGMFTTSLPEPERKPGGVDVLIDRLARRLVARGHLVRVFTYSPAPTGATYEVQRLEPPAWRERKLRRMLSVPRALNDVDFSGLDVLHLHGDDWFYRRRTLPTVRTFYGSALHEARTATRWRRRLGQSAVFALELLAARRATATYGLIPGDGRWYRTRGSLGCGVDPADRPLARSARPSILFVGTWHGRKRGRVLAQVFAREVRPRVPDAELVMVSDEAVPGPGIRWVPRPSDEELHQLYQEAWVLCLPSSYEGLGIPYLEAMAAGTPVLATPNPGAQYLLRSGRDGRIAELERLGAELVKLLTEPAAREALGRAGRRRAREFSWSAVCAGYEAAYRHAISAHEQLPRRV